MKFVFHTNVISPHQIPLARELVRILGEENYRYVYDEPVSTGRKLLGWGSSDDAWLLCAADYPSEARELCENCECLFSGVREFSLFKKRLRSGLKTAYVSERWFKPLPRNGQPKWLRFLPEIALPGWLRLIVPSYFKMAKNVARLIKRFPAFIYYGYGKWAVKDMRAICRLFGVDKAIIEERVRLWGYFVEPSRIAQENCSGLRNNGSSQMSVLWVGRFLRWKRVDTIIRAVRAANTELGRVAFRLDLYGIGAEETSLKKVADNDHAVTFHGPVEIAEVRNLMHTHDIYVLASDGREGWGAVVNESIEERMAVLGTYEAGASLTLLPKSCLFHAGDWQALVRLLIGCYQKSQKLACVGSEWTPAGAAKRIADQLARP